MFKLFVIKKIISAVLQIRASEGIQRCTFGDCNDICDKTLIALKKLHIPARRQSGQFITNPNPPDTDEEETWDHTWIVIENNYIFDPTVDQFFSSLDVDLITKQPGIYYSHPDWDGDWLVKRYKHY